MTTDQRFRRRIRFGAGVTALLFVAAACSGGRGSDAAARTTVGPTTDPVTTTTVPLDDDLRLDQIQTIGTHNSFHVAADPKEHALLAALSPDQAGQREYTHPPLTTQLEDPPARCNPVTAPPDCTDSTLEP